MEAELSDVPSSSPSGVGLAEAVLAWHATVQRDLPWRRTRDPWAVLVSEVMLQQTQVARVLPKFAAFLDRFPTVRACAAAAPAEVIKLWSGLGYNRRALALHRCAIAVRERFDGMVPSRLDDLLSLPGVGAYTARAVQAFAFEVDAAVVDTNVARVAARAFAGRRLGPKEVQELADAMLPKGSAWAWNQALLDLGAMVCRKRSPRCAECPLEREGCAWAAAGGPDPAHGSAGAGRPQSAFVGSDRQGRGRLVERLRSGPIPLAMVPEAMGWPEDDVRALGVLLALRADDMVVVTDDEVRLP